MPATTTPASGSAPVALPPVWHDARIKFKPTDLASDAVLISGASASSHQGLEWDDASTLRLSTSASNGRAVFVFKYRLP